MRKELPPSLKAIGREALPRTLALEGDHYAFVRLFKHDFFAVTALYAGPAGKAVLKIGRRAHFLGLPCGWIGRLLAAHEVDLYQQLQHLPAVPRFLGRVGRDGFAHAYVEGHPLQKGEPVPDDFFPRLAESIRTIHQRGMAYVDLEKPQNVLVGDDGRPYLIDFQISWHVPRRWGGDLWPLASIRRRLQEADLYHLKKLQRRTRPDQLTPEELAATYAKPWYIRAHQRLTRPLQQFRRRMLERLDPMRRAGERGAVND